MNEKKIRIHIEYENLKKDIEGSPDEAIQATLKFITEIYPNFELIQKVTFTPDITKILHEIEGIITITDQGPIIQPLQTQLTVEEQIQLHLLGQYIGNKIGKYKENTLTLNDLTKMVGKGLGTISGQLTTMCDERTVEKAKRGEYRITSIGIKQFSEKLLPKIKTQTIQGAEKRP
jgi:hypothetical protein